MEKVWFKLRQTDYPPEVEDSMGTGKDTGPICLGHCISDLKHIDFPINKDEIEEFQSKVYFTDTLRFKWEDSQESETGGGLGAGAPIAALMGLVIKASMQVIFRRKVQHWEEYDRLDTYIFQPDKVYVADCLEGENKLSAHIAGKKSWSMFMITGIKVARKGKRTTQESRSNDVDFDVEGDVPTIASANANLKLAHGKIQKYGGSETADFIWAVRLAKIHKGLLMKDWSVDPYNTRATFAKEAEQVDIMGTLAAEGLDNFQVVECGESNEALVLDEGENETIEKDEGSNLG